MAGLVTPLRRLASLSRPRRPTLARTHSASRTGVTESSRHRSGRLRGTARRYLSGRAPTALGRPSQATAPPGRSRSLRVIDRRARRSSAAAASSVFATPRWCLGSTQLPARVTSTTRVSDPPASGRLGSASSQTARNRPERQSGQCYQDACSSTDAGADRLCGHAPTSRPRWPRGRPALAVVWRGCRSITLGCAEKRGGLRPRARGADDGAFCLPEIAACGEEPSRIRGDDHSLNHPGSHPSAPGHVHSGSEREPVTGARAGYYGPGWPAEKRNGRMHRVGNGVSPPQAGVSGGVAGRPSPRLDRRPQAGDSGRGLGCQM
jgi:hypothetical protein